MKVFYFVISLIRGFFLTIFPSLGYKGLINTQISVYNRLKRRIPELPENELLNKLITSRIKSLPKVGSHEQEYYAPLLRNPSKTLEDVIWAIIDYEYIQSRAQEAIIKGQSMGLTADQTVALWRDFEEQARSDIRESIKKKVATVKGKVKITKPEFASILDFCLSKGFELESPGESIARSIAKTAEDIEFEIRNENDSKRLFQELLILYMWVITRACTKLFKDEDKCYACLDIFHRNVYKAYYKNTTETSMLQLEKSFRKKYLQYEKAAEKADKPGPMWWLAKAANQNIFGEVKKDPFAQMHIGEIIGTFMEYVDKVLEQTLKKGEIE